MADFPIPDDLYDAPVLCSDCDEPMWWDGEEWVCNNQLCERNWE
jgi:hypothetical protein